MSPSRYIARAALALLVVLGAARMASAAPCTVTSLCPGTGACTVTADVKCDSPATLDLGGRDLVIAQGISLQVAQGDGEGALSIRAASVTLAAKARIETAGTDPDDPEGGGVTITSTGPLSLQTGSRIDVAPDDGTLDVTAASVSLAMDASIRVAAPGDSGFLVLTSRGPVSLAAGSRIDTSANIDGGTILIDAETGDIEALGLLDLTAGSGDGGDVELNAFAGSVTVGGDGIQASGGGGFSSGGLIDIVALGDATLLGRLDVRGGDGGELAVDAEGSISSGATAVLEASATEAEGSGGSVSLLAGGGVMLARSITATASGGGFGGDLSVVADTGSVWIAAPVNVTGGGSFGAGGTVELAAALDLTVSAPVVAAGGDFGGDMTLSAERFASLASTFDARGSDSGGQIGVFSAESLDVQGSLLVDGTGASASGGRTALQACTLRVLHGAKLSAGGSGTNELVAPGTMTIHGTLTATPNGVNRLVHRTTPPTIGPGASIDPDEEVVEDAMLPCCGEACNPTTTTSTTVSSSSTTSTSTSAPGSTTTSAPATSSTTVTTTVPESGSTTSSSTPSPGTAPTPTAPSTTTSTVPPASCLDQSLAGFDGIDCYLDQLSDTLASESAESLGGDKSARALVARIAQAQRLVTAARGKTKPVPTLRRAKKHLAAFRNVARRGKRRRRIAGEIGDRLLTLAGEASAMIDGLRAEIRARGSR